MKAERVSQVARGASEVKTLDAIERISDGLRIPGVLMGLAARPWEGTDHPAHPHAQDGVDPMKRRDLLRGALAAGLTSAALATLDHTRHAFDEQLTGSAVDLDYVETAAEQYSYGYRGQDPAALLGDLVTDFDTLLPLFAQPQPVAVRARLARAAGQLAGMAAVVLHDLGSRREARAWFHTAARAAAESGDRGLYAWVLAREAMTPLNFGAPQAAADLAEQARHAAGRAPTASAALAACVAGRAYALTGNRSMARDALADADRLMGCLDATSSADTWFGHCEQKHHVHLSHALTVLGETSLARESQDRALQLSAPTSTMTRALLRIDAATCLHHQGDTEQACRATAAVLRELPAAYRTGLTVTRARNLYRAVAPQHRSEPAARDLLESLPR